MLLVQLDRYYRGVARRGTRTTLYCDLGGRDFLRGRRIRYDGVEATAVMIDREGRLVLDGADGGRRVGRERRGRARRRLITRIELAVTSEPDRA